MSPDAITELQIHVASTPPALSPSFPVDLQYPDSDVSDSPSPHDLPADHEPTYHTPAPLDLKLVSNTFPGSGMSQYSSSPTESEYFSDLYSSSPVEVQAHLQSLSLVQFPGVPPSKSGSLSPVAAATHGLGITIPEPTPDSDYRFPPPTPQYGRSTSSRPHVRSLVSPASPVARPSAGTSRADVGHPYARLYTRRESTKRRKIWNHAHEKALFTPQEISTIGAPQRRTTYTASLEAHVDRLHEQLMRLSLYPVPYESINPFCGLNCKTAKSMVAGLHQDAADLKLKRLELSRASQALRDMLYSQNSNNHTMLPMHAQGRRHSC